MKFRQYIAPSQIDEITVKQCTTVTSYKVHKLSGALAALGFDCGLTLATSSLMFGGAATLIGSATKQKTTAAKVVLGTSGALVGLAASYLCSESIDNALESFRDRMKVMEDIVEQYSSEDGYIYFYEYDGRQRHNPKRPILMKTRAENLDKAIKLISLAISNKDARDLEREMARANKLTDEKAITHAAWEIWQRDIESMKRINSDGWYQLRGEIHRDSREFEDLYGAEPGCWLQEHDPEFQQITEKAVEICALLFKDKERAPSESWLLSKAWHPFKEGHGKDALDWVADIKHPIMETKPDGLVFTFTTPLPGEIRAEATELVERQKKDCTPEDAATLQADIARFVDAFEQTPEQVLGITQTTGDDPETEGQEATEA